MKIKLTFSIAIMALGLFSCIELQQVLDVYNQSQPLTESDVAKGLKEALKVGTDTAVANLAKTNGYFGNKLYKILLPPEADIIVNNISKIPGGNKLVNDAILGINRAAEDAAKEAAPIFVNAITGMTIQDAWNILKGNDNAATEYLKKTTYNQLVNLYSPKIGKSLDKPLVAGISTSQTWGTLTSNWNKIANNPVGKIAGFTPVNTELNRYLTEKALNGLFLKIADEEKMIRKNPLNRVTELLKRVFGN
ncbi:MAG: DUF4197 domain-containing protein [Marinilabiliaceae bacterium]|nr:DUF4197 domain-containing protein [Marinilabiliaceae bacterium]